MNKQEMKFWSRMFENVPDIPSEIMQKWIDSPIALQQFLNGLVYGETTDPSLSCLKKVITNPNLRHLETVTLAPAKGDKKLLSSLDIFTYVEYSMNEYTKGTRSEDTEETVVDVYEVKKESSFWSLIKSFGNLDQLTFTQGQIVEFCSSYRELVQLERGGVYFLCRGKKQFYFVKVSSWEGGIAARGEYLLDNNYSMNKSNKYDRLVIPKQTV